MIACVGLFFSYERISAILRPPKPVALKPPPGAIVGQWTFEDEASLKLWEQKVFKGGTVFRVVPEEGGYVRSESKNACTGLFVKVDTEEMSGLHLSWRWRASTFPIKMKNTLSFRPEDDFAARVYVIFEAQNLFRSDVIEYVWDEKLPVDSSGQSPFSDRIQLLVVRSGGAGEWHEEKRDVYADYRKLFGREPKHAVGLIALMSDSDSTGTVAAADFGALTLTKES